MSRLQRSRLLSRFKPESCESVHPVTTGHALFDFNIGPFVVNVRKLSAESYWLPKCGQGSVDRHDSNRSISQGISQLLC